jgi:hypothetical protein
MTLEEALTLESYLACIVHKVCGLAGPHLYTAMMAAGRAVSILGGHPIKPYHTRLAIMLTTLEISPSGEVRNDFGGWRASANDVKNATSARMPAAGWSLQAVQGITHNGKPQEFLTHFGEPDGVGGTEW